MTPGRRRSLRVGKTILHLEGALGPSKPFQRASQQFIPSLSSRCASNICSTNTSSFFNAQVNDSSVQEEWFHTLNWLASKE